jgi:hypothetical protein
MGVAELNRVKFSGLDFDSHFDDLQARLQIKFASDFNDFALSSLGIMLVDIIAFGLDSLSFYLDRRATDLYLDTARTRKSVSRLTRQLGYKMRASIAASADLDVTVSSPLAVTVTITKGFQFQGPNDLVFEAAQEVAWSPAEQVAGDTKVVPCYQGQTFVESFVSDGAANQVFQLRRVPESSFVVAGSVGCLVDGAPFEESEFITFDTTDQFEVGFNDDPATIRFGDGVAGNIPITGGSIDVSYVASRGKEGLVAKETIDDVVTPLVANFEQVQLEINNPRGASGADDPENLIHAKIFAGQVFKTRFVAVTRSDYEALAGSYADPLFGRIAVAQAISSRSAASDLKLQTLLNDVRAAISPTEPGVTVATAAIDLALDAIDVLLGTQETTLSDIADSMVALDSDQDFSLTSSRTAKNLSLEITTDASDIQQLVIDGKADVDASSASGGEKSGINGFFDLISAETTAISGNANNIETETNLISARMGTAIDSIAEVGVDVTTAGTLLFSAESDRAAIVAAVGDSDDPATGIRLQVDTINTLVLDQDEGVETALVGVNDHVDKILAADCKANLVTVPVLARDAGGFYAPPSISLISSLQDYLDVRKEVTQTVEVVSGEDFLIPAVVSLRIGVRTGFSESVTSTEVSTAVDGVLRDRRFGVSLFLSDVIDIVLLIDAVSFVNVTIQGHTDPITDTLSTLNLDANGNLIIETSEVITKGTVTITTEAVATSTSVI